MDTCPGRAQRSDSPPMSLVAAVAHEPSHALLGWLLLAWLTGGAIAFIAGLLEERAWMAYLGAIMWGLYLAGVWARR